MVWALLIWSLFFKYMNERVQNQIESICCNSWCCTFGVHNTVGGDWGLRKVWDQPDLYSETGASLKYGKFASKNRTIQSRHNISYCSFADLFTRAILLSLQTPLRRAECCYLLKGRDISKESNCKSHSSCGSYLPMRDVGIKALLSLIILFLLDS